LNEKNNANIICGYFDADWTESFDRKLTTYFSTFMGENLVIWKNKKQNIMAQSSTETKYRAMTSKLG
jgi:hypothetical protein